MELEEMKNCWKSEDERISNSIRINRDALQGKMKGAVKNLRQKLLFQMLIGLVIAIFVLVSEFPHNHPPFRDSAAFYWGIALFVSVFAVGFATDIVFHLRLRKLDVTKTVIETQKKVRKLEAFQIMRAKLSWIIMPCAILAIFLIFELPPLTNKEGAIVLLIMLLVIGATSFFHIKYKIPRDFHELKSLISLLEEGEEEKG
jgi:hypothetical protein